MSWEGADADRPGWGREMLRPGPGEWKGLPTPSDSEIRTISKDSYLHSPFSSTGGLQWGRLGGTGVEGPQCVPAIVQKSALVRVRPWPSQGPPFFSAPADDPVPSWKAHFCLLLPAFLSTQCNSQLCGTIRDSWRAGPEEGMEKLTVTARCPHRSCRSPQRLGEGKQDGAPGWS